MSEMIRRCDEQDFEAIYEIVNDAATAYRGVIPADCWAEPYMPREKLREEIGAGIDFWGYEQDGALAGVMGIQHVRDVTLIRHAYVRTSFAAARHRRCAARVPPRSDRPTGAHRHLGGRSLGDPLLREAGVQLVSPEEKDRLLRTYWTVNERQIETSVVLAASDLVRQPITGMRGFLAPFGPVEREVAT